MPRPLRQLRPSPRSPSTVTASVAHDPRIADDQHHHGHKWAREHPVDHRRPIERAHRIKSNYAQGRAEQGSNRYRRIEGARIVGSGVKSTSPAEHLANRIGRRSCQHRDCQQSGADDPGGEQRKGELARDGAQRLGGLRRGCDAQ